MSATWYLWQKLIEASCCCRRIGPSWATVVLSLWFSENVRMIHRTAVAWYYHYPSTWYCSVIKEPKIKPFLLIFKSSATFLLRVWAVWSTLYIPVMEEEKNTMQIISKVFDEEGGKQANLWSDIGYSRLDQLMGLGLFMGLAMFNVWTK